MLYPTYPSFDDKVPYYFIDFETRESVQDINDVFYNQSFLIEWQNASDLVNVSLWQLPPTENDRANTVFIDALGFLLPPNYFIYWVPNCTALNLNDESTSGYEIGITSGKDTIYSPSFNITESSSATTSQTQTGTANSPISNGGLNQASKIIVGIAATILFLLNWIIITIWRDRRAKAREKKAKESENPNSGPTLPILPEVHGEGHDFIPREMQGWRDPELEGVPVCELFVENGEVGSRS